MPKGIAAPQTVALSVEAIRADLISRVRIPDDLLQAAINKVRAQLDARKTLFYTYQGQIVDKVSVEDHATQASAVDKILAMSGVYAREREQNVSTPKVAVEVDAVTGVVRLVVGSSGSSHEPAASSPPALEASVSDAVEAPEDDQPEIVKVSRGGMPIDVYRQLFPKDK